MTVSFPQLVRDTLAPLLTAHGFALVEETTYQVVLESPRLRAVAVFDPRGEIEVRVFRRGSEDWEAWSYSGTVGRASVGRLLEIAVDKMQADPRILKADAAFYKRLAVQRQADTEAWTAYYGGTGSRPGGRHLP